MAKIVVVDDDPGVVDACRLYLEKEGHIVEAAHSRAAGMQLLASVKPDLLILDVMLEEADDGFQMAHELKSGGFDAPILMLTSVGKVTGFKMDGGSDVVEVDAFEEKPISPDQLMAVVNKLLEGQA